MAIKNVNSTVNGTIMTNAVVKKVKSKAGKEWAVMAYKIKDAYDGEIREVSEFRKIENAEATINKARYYTVGQKVIVNVHAVEENVKEKMIFRSYLGYGELIK